MRSKIVFFFVMYKNIMPLFHLDGKKVVSEGLKNGSLYSSRQRQILACMLTMIELAIP